MAKNNNIFVIYNVTKQNNTIAWNENKLVKANTKNTE